MGGEAFLKEERPEPVQLFTCLTCNGLIFNGWRTQGLDWVGRHYAAYHSDIRLIIQNKQFKVEPSPIFCDVCNQRLQPDWMCWDHRTSERLGGFDTDGWWCVCEPCHPLLMDGKISDLLVRKVEVGSAQCPYLTAKERAEDVTRWAEILVQLIKVIDSGRRVQVGKPRAVK